MNLRTIVLSLLLPATSLAWKIEGLASNVTTMLETAYIEDCQANHEPHGFYGAFLQPCTFEFRQLKDDPSSSIEYTDPCSDAHSHVLDRPVPMQWLFNLSDHFAKMHEDHHHRRHLHEWDSMSSDDLPTADDLMLWPDQCVGVGPRCYALNGKTDPALLDALQKIFAEHGIPQDATHVKVDCTNDAMELSRLVLSVGEGFEMAAPRLILWLVTVLCLTLVASLWCCFACVRLFHGPPKTMGRRAKYQPLLVATIPSPDKHALSSYKAMDIEESKALVYN